MKTIKCSEKSQTYQFIKLLRTNFREDRISQLVSQFTSKPASCPEEIDLNKLAHQSFTK